MAEGAIQSAVPDPSCLVVAGEASGDLHAAALLRELRKRAPGLSAFGMGGIHCRAQGLECLVDAASISVMGVIEVLPALPRIFRAMRTLSGAARTRRPDVAILVDLPDFNLRLAKKLHRLGIPVAYYVSPTVWAWRKGRLKTIRRCVSRMLCILPFEEELYRSEGIEARYVGNPVLDQAAPEADRVRARASLGLKGQGLVLALLPGSRMGEVRRIFPAMLEAAKALRQDHPDLEVVVPVAPTIPAEVIRAEAARHAVVPVLVDGRAPEVVSASDAAVVASGTAVLEAALARRPMVVVYKFSLLTYWIARMLVKVAHVALVNLLAGKRIVPELIQGEMRPERIADELRTLLVDARARAAMLDGLDAVRARLGGPGASARAAAAVLELVRPPPAAMPVSPPAPKDAA